VNGARTCVIFNPAARGEHARRAAACVEPDAGVTVRPTAGPGDARRLAAAAIAEGFVTVVAAGGDGTVHEVANGIEDAAGLARARLGVIPLGTANVLARELGIPRTPREAWAVIRAGVETQLDLPCVEYAAPGGRDRRCFVQLAGAGVDARAVELVGRALKRRLGAAAYVVAAARAARERRAPIVLAGAGCELVGEQVLIGNGRLYGGPFAVFPEADPRDGCLEVRVFPRFGASALIRCGATLLARRRLGPGAAPSARLAEFELRSPARVPLELDGEFVGHLPARFSVRPRALRVAVPLELVAAFHDEVEAAHAD